MGVNRRSGYLCGLLTALPLCTGIAHADGQKMNCVDTSRTGDLGNVHVNWDLTGTHLAAPRLALSFSEARGAPFITTVGCD